MQQNSRYNEKTSSILSRKSLLTIYKFFVRPNLDYAIIYEKAFNESFKRKIEMVSGAIKGTSHDRLYQELGLEFVADMVP